MKYQSQSDDDTHDYLWNREESDIEAIENPGDDEFFNEDESLAIGDILFSDGFSNDADNAKSDKQPYRYI